MREKIDYARKLSPEELEWLRAFEEQYYGKGKSDGSEAAKEGFRRDYASKNSIERRALRIGINPAFPIERSDNDEERVPPDSRPYLSNSVTPEDLVAAREILERYPPRRSSKK